MNERCAARSRPRLAAALVLAVLYSPACRQRKPEGPSPEELAAEKRRLQRERLSDWLRRAATGETAAAAQEAQSWQPGRDMYPLYAEALHVSLSEQGAQAAGVLYLGAARARPEWAERAGDPIARALFGSQDYTAALAWAERVLECEPAPPLRARALSQALQALDRQDRLAEFAGRLPAVLQLKPAALADRLVRQAVDLCVQRRQTAVLDAFERAVRRAAPERRGFDGPFTAARARILIETEQPGAARELLLESGLAVGDAALQPLASRLLDAALKRNDREAAQSLATAALETWRDKQGTRRALLARWILHAADRQSYDAFCSRFAAALEAGLEAAALADIMGQGYHKVMDRGTDTQRARCSRLLEQTANLEGLGRYHRRSLGLLRLDDTLYRQDFGASIALLKEGVPGEEPEWHSNLIHKATAHLALQEGRIDEAVRNFRLFMDSVRGWQRPVTDPSTGLDTLKEVVLGFNEKRIGDIYAQAGRTGESRRAYRRARDYYRRALAQLEPGSPEYESARRELAAVPARPE